MHIKLYFVSHFVELFELLREKVKFTQFIIYNIEVKYLFFIYL